MMLCSSAKAHCEAWRLARRAFLETSSVPFPFFLRRRVRRFGRWFWYLHFQRDQQVVLLVRLIIPELGRAKACAVLDEGHMTLITLVGEDDPPLEREDAHLPFLLEAVIITVVIDQGGRDIPG